jgi:hypothetical protein
VIPDKEGMLIAAINDAIDHAAWLFELGDVPDDAEDEFRDLVYEERYHCGTCMVRTVMEVVWPPIEDLIEYATRRQTP